MKIHAAQPDENDGQVAKVSTEDFTRNVFEVTGMTVEIVREGVKVPNPGSGFGTSSKCAIEVTGFCPPFK
jgi:galactokinase/mevalonate kinase-like predicted kinase